jgi:hypothetical protein
MYACVHVRISMPVRMLHACVHACVCVFSTPPPGRTLPPGVGTAPAAAGAAHEAVAGLPRPCQQCVPVPSVLLHCHCPAASPGGQGLGAWREAVRDVQWKMERQARCVEREGGVGEVILEGEKGGRQAMQWMRKGERKDHGLPTVGRTYGTRQGACDNKVTHVTAPFSIRPLPVIALCVIRPS